MVGVVIYFSVFALVLGSPSASPIPCSSYSHAISITHLAAYSEIQIDLLK